MLKTKRIKQERGYQEIQQTNPPEEVRLRHLRPAVGCTALVIVSKQCFRFAERWNDFRRHPLNQWKRIESVLLAPEFGIREIRKKDLFAAKAVLRGFPGTRNGTDGADHRESHVMEAQSMAQSFLEALSFVLETQRSVAMLRSEMLHRSVQPGYLRLDEWRDVRAKQEANRIRMKDEEAFRGKGKRKDRNVNRNI